MENLSFFIHEMRNLFGVRTVTYLCARHLLSEEGFKPSAFVELGDRRKEVLYSLLKTPASAKLDNDHDGQQVGGHLEALHAREARIRAFIEDMVERCFDSLRVYHPTWWQTISHVREVFGWVANGNNDALMGTMARDYPLMEKRLRELLDRLGEKHRWLDKQEEELRFRLAPLEAKLPESHRAGNPIYKKVRSLFKAEKNITYKGVEEILQSLISQEAELTERAAPKALSKRSLEWLKLLQMAVEGSRDERNLLLHGEIVDVLDEDHPESDTPRKYWHTIVIHYLRLFLVLPLGEAVLRELIERKSETDSS